MRNLLKLIAAIVLVALCSPASAQSDQFPDRKFGSWEFYVNGDSCWLVAPSAGGEVVISTSGGKGDRLYVSAANSEWPHGDPKALFPITLTLGDLSVTEEGGNMADGRGIDVRLPERPSGYFEPLRAARRISLSGRAVSMDLPLDGGHDAIDMLERCAAVVGTRET